jgi:hypothetical protein
MPISPDHIRLVLEQGDRVELESGATWIVAIINNARLWLPPAHSRQEIDLREAELANEAARLPPQLRVAIGRRIRLLATVSVAEGDFGGIATHVGDPAASLGLFQWAMARRRAVDEHSSLWRFFADLKRRALSGSTSEDAALFGAAWRQCRNAGLEVNGERLLLHGRAATGDDIERTLQPVFGVGALRTYQLVAANDWVDRIAHQGVRNGPRRVGVGDVLSSDQALATAVLLGVNRPSYVVPVLQAAIDRVGVDDVGRLVGQLRTEALARYARKERERRGMRLLTSDMGW